MTVTRSLVGSNLQNLNSSLEKKVVKSFDDPATSANVETEVNGTPVSTEAPKVVGNVEPAEGETPEVPKTPAEERAERRNAFKRAADIEARARQMEKAAQEKLAQAQRFEEVSKKAKENPLELAKAIGMDPTEFLRQYQNQMFNIPTEVEPSPEEDVKTRLTRYEQEREEEKKKNQELQVQMVRNTYISNKILPNLIANKEKFEILNHNNIELSAGFIYDMMDQHYRATGEELNPLDVAEEMENQLAKELEDRLLAVKKFNRFSKYFQAEQPAPAPPAQLGAKTPPPKSKTISDSLGSGAPVSTMQRQRIPMADKQARLERTVQRLTEKDKV